MFFRLKITKNFDLSYSKIVETIKSLRFIIKFFTFQFQKSQIKNTLLRAK